MPETGVETEPVVRLRTTTTKRSPAPVGPDVEVAVTEVALPVPSVVAEPKLFATPRVPVEVLRLNLSWATTWPHNDGEGFRREASRDAVIW